MEAGAATLTENKPLTLYWEQAPFSPLGFARSRPGAASHHLARSGDAS